MTAKRLKRTVKGISLRLAALMLKKEANKCRSLSDCIDLSSNFFSDFPFKYCGWTIQSLQAKEEISKLLKILASHKPRFIMEIGTANGGTLFLFARVSSPDAVIISIDLPHGRFGGGYPEWKIPLYKSFAARKQKIYLIREDSHELSTLDMANKILKGHKLDFLFIDGDHTYEGVKRDFEVYRNSVGKGGIIAFHDICPHPPETGCEVNKFWSEIKDDYEYIELIKDYKQGWGGIGVLYV